MAKEITFKEVKDQFHNNEISAGEAIKLLKKINKKHPSEVVQFEIAMLEFNSGKKEKNYEKLLKFRNSKNTHVSSRANIALSRYYIANKNLGQAREYLNDVDNSIFGGELNRQLAVIEKATGNYETSRRRFEESIKKAKNPKSILGLGLLELKYKHFDEARAYANILKEMNEYNYAYKLLGNIEFKLNNYEEARDNFLQLLGSSIEDEAKLYLGTIYFDMGNNELAMKYFQDLSNSIYKYHAMVRIARIKDFEGFHEEALDDLLNASAHLTDDHQYIDLCKTLSNLGRYEEALSYLEKVHSEEFQESVEKTKVYIDIYKKDFESALHNLRNSSFAIETPKNFLWYYVFEKRYDTSFYNLDQLCYGAKQILKYKSKWAIKHIKDHLSEDDTKSLHTLFYENVDVTSLYFEVRDKIQNMTRNSRNFTDKYIVKTNQIVGNIEGTETSYVIAVVIPDTKNILTMYPVVVSQKLRGMDYSKVRTK